MPTVRHDIPLDPADRMRSRIVHTIPFDGYSQVSIRCGWCETEIIHWHRGTIVACEDCGRETCISALSDHLFAVISPADLAYLAWRFSVDPENPDQVRSALYRIPGWRSHM